jgi:peroxiredoxin
VIDLEKELAIGETAHGFDDLLGVDGKRYALASFDDKRWLVVIFSCNGCPTVKANEDRMIAIQDKYAPQGVQLVAINSNNPYLSPSDAYAEMVKRAHEKGFNFPYLKDEDGRVALHYGALTTPHVFLLDPTRRLVYRGRIDETRDPARASYSDLENALQDLLSNAPVRVPETAPFGCAIVR